MSTMTAPTARMNVLRRIGQQCHSFPSASNFERISETILSSMDVDDFADAHSASITKSSTPQGPIASVCPEFYKLRQAMVLSCFPFN